jgi:hypothetical protein
MKLIVRVQRPHGVQYASAAQVAAVQQAFDGILSASQFTYFDAMLAMDELVREAEMRGQYGKRYKPKPFEPFHGERLALHDKLVAAANEAAGERVSFFMVGDHEDPDNMR